MTYTASSSAPLSASDDGWSPPPAPPTACPSTLDPTEKRPTPPWAAPALTEAADLVGMPGLAGRRVEIVAGPSSTVGGLLSSNTPPRFVSSSIGTDDRVAVRLLDGPAVVTVEVSAGSPVRFVPSTWTTKRAEDLGPPDLGHRVDLGERSGFLECVGAMAGPRRVRVSLAGSPGGRIVVTVDLDPSAAVEVAR